jgi:hypothetical protein
MRRSGVRFPARAPRNGPRQRAVAATDVVRRVVLDRQNRIQRLFRAGSGETFKLLVDRARAVELVEGSGWDVTEETGMPEAARDLVPSESGLPVAAINEHETLVAGERS